MSPNLSRQVGGRGIIKQDNKIQCKKILKHLVNRSTKDCICKLSGLVIPM